MGLGILSSSSSFDYNPVKIVKEIIKNRVNPRPNNYKILKSEEQSGYLILMIKYLDCTNYEGKKILVFEDCSLDDLMEQKLIDPHFSENKKMKSPIARFEPTERGWNWAIKFCWDNQK